MINRHDYINAIVPFIDKPVVNIFAGIRRNGKSTILKCSCKSFCKEAFRRIISSTAGTQKWILTAKDMYNDICEADFHLPNGALCFDSRLHIVFQRVQVCVRMSENFDREVGNLMEIRDHYPKYIVMFDSMATGNENGIRIVHLIDLLINPYGNKKPLAHFPRSVQP